MLLRRRILVGSLSIWLHEDVWGWNGYASERGGSFICMGCFFMLCMKGVYVVSFLLDESCSIEVGSLGELEFDSGLYGYVGSAMGAGGIESRVGRHLETGLGQTGSLFWHIDYVLDESSVEIVSVWVSDSFEECELAGEFGSEFSCVSSFGVSDCGCESHLFKGDVVSYCEELGLSEWE